MLMHTVRSTRRSCLCLWEAGVEEEEGIIILLLTQGE